MFQGVAKRTVGKLTMLAYAYCLPAAESHVFSDAQKAWWAIQPISHPSLPAVKRAEWARTPIDHFILSKLEDKGLAPNPRADRLTLLRRATVDMTGLQPTEEEILDFTTDKSANAWEKVVDRLLASPAYGERWARHWLDVARYADSNGFKADETRPHIWRYRDWVINALNADLPYDEFVRQQIAGDELFPGDPDALVAMGFNRHWIDETNAVALNTRRQETLDEMTNATSAAFLGITMSCARCHDHKFDPILQKDYYRLQAFFANTTFGDGPLPLKDPARRLAYHTKKAAWSEKTVDIRAEIAKIVEPLRVAKVQRRIKAFEEDVQKAILLYPAKRNALQRYIFHLAEARIAFNEESDTHALRTLSEANRKRFADLKTQLSAFDSLKPEPLPQGQFMIDLGAEAPPTYVLLGGRLDAKDEEVVPGFPTVLDPSEANVAPLPTSTGRRTALAKWLTDRKNPLPARVMVNRIWHYHFGSGIVATPSNFGSKGAVPTHAELLDYLASTFIDSGWSIKGLHRIILLSNTYQQSSANNELSATTDPDNKLLWRYQRRRMEAEAIRDGMLQVSGLLNRKMRGPGIFPPLPPGTTSRVSPIAVDGGWPEQQDAADNRRRSIYIFVRRNLRYPMLQEFDAADTFESCDFRRNTVTPAQSLELMNNDLVLDWAAGLASRALNNTDLTPNAQIDRAFRLAYGRAASAEEKCLAVAFLTKQAAILRTSTKLKLPANIPAGMNKARAAAFVDFTHMLLNSNEFLYLN